MVTRAALAALLAALLLTGCTGHTAAPHTAAPAAHRAPAFPVTPTPSPVSAATVATLAGQYKRTPESVTRFLARAHALAPKMTGEYTDTGLMYWGHTMCATFDLTPDELDRMDFRGEGEKALVTLAATETLCPKYQRAITAALAKGYK